MQLYIYDMHMCTHNPMNTMCTSLSIYVYLSFSLFLGARTGRRAGFLSPCLGASRGRAQLAESAA